MADVTIYHLADPTEWADAQRAGRYERSTRGRSLEQEGFVHCSEADQWPGVRRRFYDDVAGDLLLLELDESALRSPVVREPAPGTDELFPHVYGPLDLDAVVATTVLHPPHG
ncbi:DUF952 domain-containing protein [Lapillicoccus jejuensis]|uniref:Uncharacterized protein (DUF952 family) n=1 Tax=Lapillicoccus jejuensis TaxID=402171 RepID=A0A542E6W4_9MICO|nr:uncharacterized protein (DUF952 family) [Lapillicoccus jejuensis]